MYITVKVKNEKKFFVDDYCEEKTYELQTINRCIISIEFLDDYSYLHTSRKFIKFLLYVDINCKEDNLSLEKLKNILEDVIGNDVELIIRKWNEKYFTKGEF